jgi:spore coat protein U-like protein
MNRVIRLTAAVALLALALSPGFARAQVSSSVVTLPVQASVQSGCLIAAVGINFGAISPLLVEEDRISAGTELSVATAEGDVALACGSFGPTSGTTILISMDLGASGDIAPILGIGTNVSAIRAMTNGTSFLLYDLFKPTCNGAPPVVPAVPCTSGLFLCASGSLGGEWGAGGASATNPTAGAQAFVLTFSDYNSCNKSIINNGSSVCTIPVCGSVPGDQVQPLTPGIYTDTVTVSVLF